jgi:hypothetical protein
MDPGLCGMTVPGWLSRSRFGLRPSALTFSAVITGLVPVIPIRKALRLTASGWPGQARP